MRIKFRYKNHKGHTEERDVDVVSLHFDFTSHPEYGYQPGWCIAGWDYSRGRDGRDYRSFHLHNIILPPTNAVGLFNWKLVELKREVQHSPIFNMVEGTRVRHRECREQGILDGSGTVTIGGKMVGVKWLNGSRSATPIEYLELEPEDCTPGPMPSGATIDEMVNRFLNWKLPDDFSPDGGISFQKISNAGTPHEHRYAPVGTNLLTATQAKAMIEYMLAGTTVPAPLGPPDWDNSKSA